MKMVEWGKGWLRAKHDRTFLVCMGLSLVLWLGMSGWMLWKLIPEGKRSGVIVTHYTIYLGIDQVQAWPYVFVVVGVALAMVLVNAVIAIGLSAKDDLAAKAIGWMTLVMMVLWIVSQWYIVRVNV